MFTIGEIAHCTGVSRRMLRHWEAEGLLSPAAVDATSGYRRYTGSQVGRVHAIAALRSLGFGLDAIGALLDPALTTPRLLEVLTSREHELERQIESDRAALGEVQRRLRSIHEGLQMTSQTLQLQPLPAVRIARITATVRDETEIGRAVVDLVARVRSHLAADGHTWDGTIVRTYDAEPGGSTIEVAVGIEVDGGPPPSGLELKELPAEPKAASITYDGALTGEADAWLALDTALEPYGLTTTSTYRVVVAAASVTLQARIESRC